MGELWNGLFFRNLEQPKKEILLCKAATNNKISQYFKKAQGLNLHFNTIEFYLYSTFNHGHCHKAALHTYIILLKVILNVSTNVYPYERPTWPWWQGKPF